MSELSAHAQSLLHCDPFLRGSSDSDRLAQNLVSACSSFLGQLRGHYQVIAFLLLFHEAISCFSLLLTTLTSLGLLATLAFWSSIMDKEDVNIW